MVADTDEEALASVPEKMKEELGTMLHSALIGSLDTIADELPHMKSLVSKNSLSVSLIPFNYFNCIRRLLVRIMRLDFLILSNWMLSGALRKSSYLKL